jgi:hypothetical protein
MNERIVKLISEADAYARTIAEKYTPDSGEVSYLWEAAFRKKFAELIVGECCQKLENDGMVEVAMELKEHFGVEE